MTDKHQIWSQLQKKKSVKKFMFKKKNIDIVNRMGKFSFNVDVLFM